MNLDSFVNTYGVFILILIYVVVNVAYKNLLNLIIFIVVILATLGIFDNKINAVILAYIISILYGIVKNFHLLENFKGNKQNKVTIKSKEEEIEMEEIDTPSETEMNIMESSNIIKSNESTGEKVPDMDILISTKLVEKFVKNLKSEDNSLVIYKNVELDDIKPTIKNLNTIKLEKMTRKIKEGSNKDKIYISSDYFIIDGHYKWFSLKSLSNSNDAKFSDTTNVVLIDMSIKKIIKTLEEYKIDFNKEQYDKFTIDAEKMSNAEKSIKAIKIHIKKLDEFHKNLQKVKLF